MGVIFSSQAGGGLQGVKMEPSPDVARLEKRVGKAKWNCLAGWEKPTGCQL